MEKNNGIKLNAEQLQNESDIAFKKILEICDSPNWEKKD